MLTFRFTGVNGEMVEEEMLASGMVGKQVAFTFSEEWDNLRKVAVYRAGDLCCSTVDVGEVDTIPAEVLSCSLRRLQVGIYGISEDGSVVTPTIYAIGPFIHISAELGDDPCFDPENPFWIRLEQAIGELAELNTQEKTSLVLAINENWRQIQSLAEQNEALQEEAVRFTAQNLTAQQKTQVRQNIGAVSPEELPAPGLSQTAANLLVTILKNGIYTQNQADNILLLSADICGTVLRSITGSLEHVVMDNQRMLVEDKEAYSVRLTAQEGYELETVTVTMGGIDITGQVYADGVISIAEVTADVVIQAVAKKVLKIQVSQVIMGTTSFVANMGLQVSDKENFIARATLVPIGQYLEKGKTYRFDIGDAAQNYYFGIQIMTVSQPGLTFAMNNGEYTYYDSVTSRLVDTGWMKTDYTYTAGQDNLIFTMNFKNNSSSPMGESDYAVLKENIVIEEVA